MLARGARTKNAHKSVLQDATSQIIAKFLGDAVWDRLANRFALATWVDMTGSVLWMRYSKFESKIEHFH